VSGSIINRIIEGPAKQQPEVGMGVTVTMYSDRNAGTITELVPYKKGAKAGQIRIIRVRMDDFTVVSGSEADGSARYEFAPGPGDRHTVDFLPTKRGWRRKGGGDGLVLGSRDRYYDPHF